MLDQAKDHIILGPENSLNGQVLSNEVGIFSVPMREEPWRRNADNVIRLGPHNILWIVDSLR